MTLVAGVDIGNATTEIVFARDGEPVAAERIPTRGAKGSPTSVRQAAGLVRRMAAGCGETPQLIRVTRLHPVTTGQFEVNLEPPSTGRLQVVGTDGTTVGGQGHAVGRPVASADLAAVRPGERVIAVVDDDFRSVLPALREALARGVLGGVITSRDEAVLLANRLPVSVPIIDRVALQAIRYADRLALEVAAPGAALGRLTDPLWLMTQLRLATSEAGDARSVAEQLQGRSHAVVALGAPRAEATVPAVQLQRRGGQTVSLATAVGERSAYETIVLQGNSIHVQDVHLVDVATVTGLRLDPVVALAYLQADPHDIDPGELLEQELQLPVATVSTEAHLARLGALHTLGDLAAEATVLDLGAGTADLVGPDGDAVTRAGCGQLLTVSVAAALGVTAGAAEWIKRGPCERIEEPQLRVGEDGSRRFSDPAPAAAVGQLAVPGPAGLIGFGGMLPAGDWRNARIALKERVLGDVTRGGLRGGAVVLVGGPASDDEAVSAITTALPEDALVGRGDVAGCLGHRYAVAYGLTLWTD